MDCRQSCNDYDSTVSDACVHLHDTCGPHITSPAALTWKIFVTFLDELNTMALECVAAQHLFEMIVVLMSVDVAENVAAMEGINLAHVDNLRSRCGKRRRIDADVKQFYAMDAIRQGRTHGASAGLRMCTSIHPSVGLTWEKNALVERVCAQRRVLTCRGAVGSRPVLLSKTWKGGASRNMIWDSTISSFYTTAILNYSV